MLNPEKISFTLIHLKEKEKNHFATQLNKVFPNDNCTVFIYDTVGNNGWLKQAISKSKYVIMEKDKAPLWIEELIPESKTYYISAEQTVEQTFQKINEERKD